MSLRWLLLVDIIVQAVWPCLLLLYLSYSTDLSSAKDDHMTEVRLLQALAIYSTLWTGITLYQVCVWGPCWIAILTIYMPCHVLSAMHRGCGGAWDICVRAWEEASREEQITIIGR